MKHRRAFERLLGAGSGLTTPRDRTRVLSCSAPPGQSTLASAWIGLPARTLAASAPTFRFGSDPFRALESELFGLFVDILLKIIYIGGSRGRGRRLGAVRQGYTGPGRAGRDRG